MKINYKCKHCDKLNEYPISGDYVNLKEFNDVNEHVSECIDTITAQCPFCQTYNKLTYFITITLDEDSQKIVNY